MSDPTNPALLADDGPVLELAGKGDHAAQARMVDHIIGCIIADQVPVAVALGAAEAFARMAAADNSISNRRKLGGLLLWQAQNLWSSGYHDRSAVYQAEAVANLNSLADDGDENAAELLANCAGSFSADILKVAAELCRPRLPDPDPLH